MLLKNLRWGSLIVLFPVFLLAELVTWGYVLLFAPRQWQDKLRALGWIASHWRLVLEKRRQAQSLRRIPDAQILRCHSSRLDFRQTATGLTVPLAHWLFNPLFFLLKRLALALILW
jgi:hypothetical protein